jgi:(heptosyl)LPS beta-1,4-glucosyltransferase
VKLSALVITKDAASDLPRCLASLSFADEVVVLDSGSSDGTVDIAEGAGARVHQSADWPGFGPQRQRAQALAQGEWVLWIDADEVVTPELAEAIQTAIAHPQRGTVYRVNRLTSFFGRFIRHSGWYPDRIVRLYMRDEYGYDDALVHEKVTCPGARTVDLSGHLLHYTTGDFRSYLEKSVRYASDWAEQRAARGKSASLAGACLHSAAAFIRKYFLQRGFLDGRHGFLLAVLTGFYVFNKYAALWLKHKKHEYPVQGEREAEVDRLDSGP